MGRGGIRFEVGGGAKLPRLSLAMLADSSLWILIAGNLLSIVLAITQGWSLSEMMWIYWSQSVAIGIANVIRMLSLKNFSTAGIRMNGELIPETTGGKLHMTGFFAMHYGVFHVVYLTFMLKEKPFGALTLEDLIFVTLCITGFVFAHFFSLWKNFTEDFRDKKPNIGALMFYPYMRIIPMHLTIMFGGLVDGAGIFIFLILKTAADAGMHVVEHAIFQQAGEAPGTIRD